MSGLAGVPAQLDRDRVGPAGVLVPQRQEPVLVQPGNEPEAVVVVKGVARLRAIGQQKPIVAYQKEAYEPYQEMLRSVQAQIVRSLFLLPPQQQRRPAASPPHWGGLRGGQPRQPVLRTSGGSDQAASKPMPARGSAGGQKLGRNDPCFCGSGRKYKDCHLKADQRANIVRYVTER